MGGGGISAGMAGENPPRPGVAEDPHLFRPGGPKENALVCPQGGGGSRRREEGEWATALAAKRSKLVGASGGTGAFAAGHGTLDRKDSPREATGRHRAT